MAAFNPYCPTPGYFTGLPNLPTPPPNASGEARLTYFLTRSNGHPVALIPADELPVALESVPRVLSPSQTYGMQYVGVAPYTGGTFKVERGQFGMQRSISQPGNESGHYRFHSGDSSKQYQAPDALARQALANNAANSSNATPATMASLPKRPVSASQTAVSWRRSEPLPSLINTSTDATQNAIDAILRSEAGAETAERIGYRRHDSTPPPSGIVPDQEKKVYCTYWILHGTCAFLQQGCRYLHEMPDRAKLAEIGIKHVPTWWKEENATFKMGGKAATVGPIMRPDEWLNARKGSDADSEGSSGSDESECRTLTSGNEKEKDREDTRKVDEKESEVSGARQVGKKEDERVKEGKKVMEKLMKEERARTVNEAKPEPTKVYTIKQSSTKSSPIVPPARPSTPADEDRKMSCGSDLINFAPLQPTLSSRPKSAETQKRITPDAITSKARELSATKPSSPTNKAMKVFVPAGESQEAHIADAKKRERVTRTKASRTPSPTQRAKAENKQVQEMQKTKPEGIAASRWAPGAAGSGTKTEEPIKRVRSGCRPRRPASSPASKVKAGEGAEKK